MKDIKTFINESNVSIEDLLEQIVKSAPEQPTLYDDTESYDASDDFEYWQHDNGSWDETFEIVKDEINDKAVAGWFTEESFEATEKLLPKKILSLIKKKGKQIYKKNNDEVIKWEGNMSGYDYKILKFRQWRSHSGTYAAECWYVIALEK